MPPIQGFSPAAIYLDLIDTDASVYTNGAYPVDLPDVSLFEIKQFSILFTDTLMQHRFLIATIDSISLVPEPGTLSLAALAGFLVTGFGAINRRRTVGNASAPAV